LLFFLYHELIRVLACLKQAPWLWQETNNHLEGWYNQLNKKTNKNKLRFYKLLNLLIEEQSIIEILINQVLSKTPAAEKTVIR
ncbi:hypothetical protein T4A_4041, partial [Trichinella pseudospiralis]